MNPARAEHCPFVNRRDPRCAEMITVRHLQHAFDHCFDQYEACPIYLERLVERRVRQVSGDVDAAQSLIQLRIRTQNTKSGSAVA